MLLTIEEGINTLKGRENVAVIAHYAFIAFCLPLAAIDLGQLGGAIYLQALPSEAWVSAVTAVGILKPSPEIGT